MKHKVSELDGMRLDAAVAKACGFAWSATDADLGRKHVRAATAWPRSDEFVFEPSADWSDGGPIIQRERITLHAPEGNDLWLAYVGADILGGEVCSSCASAAGATALIAAMRAYVASKMGEEVELP